MLQHDKQLTKIATKLEKKVVKHLQELQNDNPDVYKEFFEALGINIKFGIYNSYGEKNDLLKGLLMYKTLKSDSLISLEDYVREMKEGQKYIYFASASSKEDLLSMPQMDVLKKKEFDVLLLTDEVDEFVLQVLQKFNDIEFKSVNQGDLDLLTDDEKESAKKLAEEKQDLLSKIKTSLNGKVKDVVISSRLTDSPVCLVSGDGISFEMEKVMNELPNGSNLKAERILEINPNHPIFNVLENIQNDEQLLNDYTSVLLNQALLLEGFKLENPNEFIEKMCKIMIEATK
jgi:molecular chaperone HtpG